MNKIAKKRKEYECKICYYLTYNIYDYNKHIETKKHKSNVLAMDCSDNSINIEKNALFVCSLCNKEYKDYSGLWRHKKKCTNANNNKIIEKDIEPIKPNTSDRDLMMMIIKENSDLKTMMMEIIKNGTHNITNSNNKTFNLQVFLNETCKDAMNIMDFVNSIEIDLDDLEKVGELGYVNGMTNIILKNLNALDITKRPLHCTDVKREIMYIKDDNKWEKETENKDKLKKALKYIIHKNAKMLNVFKAKYPDCIKSYSNRCDQYNKLVIEVLGGKGDNEAQNNEKIIRRIAREVTINK